MPGISRQNQTHLPALVAIAFISAFAQASSAISLTSDGSIPFGFHPITLPGDGEVSIAGATADGTTVAGMINSSQNGGQMFVWEPSSGFNLVELPEGSQLSNVGALSADGTTIGGQIRPAGAFHAGQAFRWTQTGGFELIGTLSVDRFDRSYVQGLSADGEVVVGYSDTPEGRRGFRWTESDGMIDLGHRGSSNNFYDPFSVVNDVSADGQIIAGYSTVAGMSSAQMARWTATTGWQILGSLPGGVRSSGGTVMTPDGRMVLGYNQGDKFDSVYWTEENGLSALPRLPGYTQFAPSAVTPDGSLITAIASDSEGPQAMIWQQEASGYQPSLLSDYLANHGLLLNGWKVWAVQSISPDGKIFVGTAFDRRGQVRGFVASIASVPEPMSIWLAVFAVCAAGRLFRAR